LKYLVVVVLSFAVSLFGRVPYGAAQEQKLVFEGAVITSHGSVRAQSAINSGLGGSISGDHVV